MRVVVLAVLVDRVIFPASLAGHVISPVALVGHAFDLVAYEPALAVPVDREDSLAVLAVREVALAACALVPAEPVGLHAISLAAPYAQVSAAPLAHATALLAPSVCELARFALNVDRDYPAFPDSAAAPAQALAASV